MHEITILPETLAKTKSLSHYFSAARDLKTRASVLEFDNIPGVPKKDPLVYFDDSFGKYGPILTIFSPLQHKIYDAQKLSYLSHLTFIMLPLYLVKQTLMLVSMQIFLDHATKQISMYSNG